MHEEDLVAGVVRVIVLLKDPLRVWVVGEGVAVDLALVDLLVGWVLSLVALARTMGTSGPTSVAATSVAIRLRAMVLMSCR